MELAKYIDHTILKPDATREEVSIICQQAKKYGFASVCVNQYYTEYVKSQLDNTDVKVCTVIGFPLGAVTTEVKVYETKQAVLKGADEIDMVINIGAIKNKDYDYVKKDIEAVVESAKPAIVKVILETCLLNQNEIIKACELSVQAKAAFVKTSTGFSKAGANVEDIFLMRKTVGNNAGVKASGGVKDFETANKLIEAGATRIGTSSGIAIVNQLQNEKPDEY